MPVGAPSWLDQGELAFATPGAVTVRGMVFVVDGSGQRIGRSRMVFPGPDGQRPVPLPPVIHELSALLVGARPPVECITGVHPHDSFVLVVIAGAGRERSVFLVEEYVLYQHPWKARELEVPREVGEARIVACAGGEHHLYVALEGGEIQQWRLEQPTWGQRWSWEPEIRIAGPRAVQALAVGTFDGSEVVYAAAGDTIHRFGADGTPDQQIEVVMREGAK
jgi:hypothetical protein